MEDHQVMFSQLAQMGLSFPDMKWNYDFRNFLLGRIVSCCFTSVFTAYIDITNSRNILKAPIEETTITEIITKIVTLEKNRLLEVEYFYFFYGFSFQGEDLSLNEAKDEKLIISSIEKLEALSLHSTIPSDENSIKHNHRKFEFLHGAAGWISGVEQLSYANMNEFGLQNQLTIIPAEIYQDALQLLGFSHAKVRLIARTSRFSRFRISFHISKGSIGYSRPYSGVNWIKEERFPFHNEKVLDLTSNVFHFFRQYTQKWQSLQPSPFQTLIFSWFSRFYTAKSSMDQILEGCILLEALLSNSNSEISFQFSTKIALLLGETLEDRNKIFKLVRLFYNLRSKIVHEGGGKTYQKAYQKLKKHVHNVQAFSNYLIRAVIFQFFMVREQTLIFIPKDQISSMLQNMILGNKDEKNHFPLQQNMKQEFLNTYIRLNANNK